VTGCQRAVIRRFRGGGRNTFGATRPSGKRQDCGSAGASRVEGDGGAIMPALFGHAEDTHDPDAEVVEFVAALLPWLCAA
jgi:hypothetical protein